MLVSTSLECRGVRREFAGFTALHDLDFTLEPPEVVALVGVNGAGKSTLIKLMLDLLPPTRGGLNISGLPAAEPRARAELAYLPERFLPPHYLNAAQCLAWMTSLYGAKPQAERQAQVLAQLDLDPDRLSLPVGSLSKGTAQKLGLAAVVLSERSLWLLDEPLSGLDPIARAGFLTLLAEHRAAGGSVLYATHVLSDVNQIADRLLLLHAGQVLFLGGVPGLLTRTGCSHTEAAYFQLVAEARSSRV